MPLRKSRAMPLASRTTTRPTTAISTAFLAIPPALPLRALGHQHEPGPDDGEEAQAHPGVGHAAQHRVDGGQHLFLLAPRCGGDGGQRRAGGKQDARNAPYHGQLHQEESPAVVCSARGGGGLGGGTYRPT